MHQFNDCIIPIMHEDMEDQTRWLTAIYIMLNAWTMHQCLVVCVDMSYVTTSSMLFSAANGRNYRYNRRKEKPWRWKKNYCNCFFSELFYGNSPKIPYSGNNQRLVFDRPSLQFQKRNGDISRPTLSQLWSFQIRPTTFPNYTKFVNLLIFRL